MDLSLGLINYKNVMLLILCIGLFFIVLDIGRSSVSCPEQQTVYKYVPRTFVDEQNNPKFASTVYKDMFDKSSPWMSSFTGPLKEDTN